MTFGAFQGRMRPIVEAAWKNHVGLLGLSASDAVTKDEWYRDNLWAACRIKSSKSATSHQRQLLLEWFSRASGAPVTIHQPPAPPYATSSFPRIIGWSPSQQQAFWKLAEAARANVSSPQSAADPASLASWAFSRLESDGLAMMSHGSLDFGTSTDGFDASMAAMAVAAADRYWIDRTSRSAERRLLFQMERFLTDLSWLEGKPVDWSYCRAIYDQAKQGGHLPEQMSDCPASLLVKVLSMLDTRIRRLCAKHGIRPCHCPTRPAVSLDLLDEWRFYHHPSPGHTRSPSGAVLQASSTSAA